MKELRAKLIQSGKKNVKDFSAVKLLILTFLIINLTGCVNPFALPQLNNNQSSQYNLKTPDNARKFFEFSYSNKELENYKSLFTDDFLYYGNYYESGTLITKEWGKEEEIRLTEKMFEDTYEIDLTIFEGTEEDFQGDIDGDGTEDIGLIEYTANIKLTVYLTASTALTADQWVTFIFKENSSGDWQIIRWIDIPPAKN